MGRNAIETVLGALVLVVAGLFVVFAYSSADLQKVKGYTVNAYFPMVDGIKDGTDVKINGVKVGSVSGLNLVTTPGINQYKVDVKMTILPTVQLPTDSIAMIASESLLGGKYLSIEVGIDEELIKTDGAGRITHTQSPMRLDDLIGQLIYGSKKNESGAQSSSNPAASQAAPAVEQAPAPAPARASVKKSAPPKPRESAPASFPSMDTVTQPSNPAPAPDPAVEQGAVTPPPSAETVPAPPPAPAPEPAHP